MRVQLTRPRVTPQVQSLRLSPASQLAENARFYEDKVKLKMHF